MLRTAHEPEWDAEHEDYWELAELTSLRVRFIAKRSSDHQKQINKVGSFTSLGFFLMVHGFYSFPIISASLTCIHPSGQSSNLGSACIVQASKCCSGTSPAHMLLSDWWLASSIKSMWVVEPNPTPEQAHPFQLIQYQMRCQHCVLHLTRLLFL